jgi:hypothetical protein
MTWDQLLLFLTATVEIYCPLLLLLYLRRWKRSWQNALVVAVVAAPVTAFFLTGGEAWLSTYYRVVIRGDTSVPDRCGRTVTGHLTLSFAIWGVFGALSAAMGFGVLLLQIGMIRLVSPRIFNRLIRS